MSIVKYPSSPVALPPRFGDFAVNEVQWFSIQVPNRLGVSPKGSYPFEPPFRALISVSDDV